jgi:hypothetical protein
MNVVVPSVSLSLVLFWKENRLSVLENKVLKIIFGTKAGEMKQAGIPATLVDLCLEGIFLSLTGKTKYPVFFFIYIYIYIYIYNGFPAFWQM